MTKTNVYLINHTHWDREWFLTSIYTSQWIAGLVDRIEGLAARNPGFTFLLDGQTLVIEDLLGLVPEYEEKVRRLVGRGHLTIGPYYCQPDWQLSGGELLVRNLLYGREDMEHYGGQNSAGWLVDTFGHIGQAPQLHRLFGLNAVYVWRGVPEMLPYFSWEGSDGSRLFTINLFGGYRNLYGITHAPEVAGARLRAEVSRLSPYYPTPDIPLFDGYDLEENPEDPLTFYREMAADLSPDLALEETSPADFATLIRGKLRSPPRLAGELNSGKFGATFPGTLCARTYLKIMQRDCEEALFRRAEPLAVLARLRGRAYPAGQYDQWARLLLQNAVHDCICGVSIDQVHEKMEFHYRQIWEGVEEDIHQSLRRILETFAPGCYVVSSNPFPYEGWQEWNASLAPVRAGGIGVWPLGEAIPIEWPETPATNFTWENEHYRATVRADGTVQVGGAHLGELRLVQEQGDCYSDEAGPDELVCRPLAPPVVERRSALHCVLRYHVEQAWRNVSIEATIWLHFDPSPLVRWEIDLDSRGTDFRLEMLFHTGLTGALHAGMPFDTVRRIPADRDLLPRQLEPELENLLLGQREVEEVRTFPFHDFVSIEGNNRAMAVLAKGLHAYRASDTGSLALPLRRSVEWLTAAELPHRVGDAGPYFYVPDARCERRVHHELALFAPGGALDEMELQRINAAYQNPPLLVESQGSGSEREWEYPAESLPLSALTVTGDRVLARVYNPTRDEWVLRQPRESVSPWGEPAGEVRALRPKEIRTLSLERLTPLPPNRTPSGDTPLLSVAYPPWRVGMNGSVPASPVLARLREKASTLDAQAEQVAREMREATGRARYLLEHQYYVLKREACELRLSLLLNERKRDAGPEPSEVSLFHLDEEIARLGLELNRLRIKRRIFDYVAVALQAGDDSG